MPKTNFNPSQDTSDQIRERKVNEVMEAFFGSDGYDEEMKTMVGELLDVHNGDKAQVERQVGVTNFMTKAIHVFARSESLVSAQKSHNLPIHQTITMTMPPSENSVWPPSKRRVKSESMSG